ncbi:MAG: carbon starvation CstA family protein [Caldisericia bacterium]
MKLYYLSIFITIFLFVLYFLTRFFFKKWFKVKKEGGFSLVPFGEKLGATGGLYLFLAPIVAMGWGYLPVIIYTIISLIFLGYPLSFFSTLFPKRFNIKELFNKYKNIKNILLIFLIIFSLILTISFIHYTAELLSQNLSTSTSFLFLIPLSLLFSLVLIRKKEDIVPYTVLFIVLLFYIIFLGGFFPIRIPFTVITGKFTWGIILTALLFLFVFLNENYLSRPFSYLSSFLLFVLIFGGIFGPLIGVRIQREPLIPISQSGFFLPTILGVLSFGIFSGFDSLFSVIFTGNEIKGERDSFSTSLLTSTILSLIAIFSSFSLIIYAKTEGLIKNKDPLTLFQEGTAKFLRFAGITESYSKNFVLFITLVIMFSFMVYVIKTTKKYVEITSEKKNNLLPIILIIIPFITFFLPKDTFGGITNLWFRLININTSMNFLLAGILLFLVSIALKQKLYVNISKIINLISTILFIYLTYFSITSKNYLSLIFSIIFLIINIYLNFNLIKANASE